MLSVRSGALHMLTEESTDCLKHERANSFSLPLLDGWTDDGEKRGEQAEEKPLFAQGSPVTPKLVALRERHNG